jgi:hypothetical protein
MDYVTVLTIAWIISLLAAGFCGALLGYRQADRYWRGRDKWYKTAETIREQMEQDGWIRP